MSPELAAEKLLLTLAETIVGPAGNALAGEWEDGGSTFSGDGTDGGVIFQGTRYKSPSGAGGAAKGTIAGRPMATDGWRFWHYRNSQGELLRLDHARQEYIRKKRG